MLKRMFVHTNTKKKSFEYTHYKFETNIYVLNTINYFGTGICDVLFWGALQIELKELTNNEVLGCFIDGTKRTN